MTGVLWQVDADPLIVADVLGADTSVGRVWVVDSGGRHPEPMRTCGKCFRTYSGPPYGDAHAAMAAATACSLIG